MTLDFFDDPAAFARLALPGLEAAEAANNLPLGMIDLLLKRPELAVKSIMARISDGSQELIALRIAPRKLIIGQTDASEAMILHLAQSLAERNSDLGGLIAPKGMATGFAAQWQALTGQSATIEMEQRLYALTALQPLKPPAGRFRLAGIHDLGPLLGFVEGFLRDALPHEKHDQDALRQKTLQQIEAGELAVWEVRDRPVSMACITRPTRRGSAISLVYTPPEDRGKGYASACVAGLSEHILRAGKQFCCLFTDLANPTSNAIYLRIGYEPVLDLQSLIFQ